MLQAQSDASCYLMGNQPDARRLRWYDREALQRWLTAACVLTVVLTLCFKLLPDSSDLLPEDSQLGAERRKQCRGMNVVRLSKTIVAQHFKLLTGLRHSCNENVHSFVAKLECSIHARLVCPSGEILAPSSPSVYGFAMAMNSCLSPVTTYMVRS
jgi:hypothetical protein